MTKKAVWQPLDLASLPNCRLIACDPSITATGLVLLEVHEGVVMINEAAKIGTVPTSKLGWEDTFMRTEALESKMNLIIRDWAFFYDKPSVVCEAPPVGGGMHRTESTILAGYAFRSAASDFSLNQLPLVTANAHKKLISGDGRATKQAAHAELKKLFPQIINHEAITNEALRDSLSVSLYAAWRIGNDDGSTI